MCVCSTGAGPVGPLHLLRPRPLPHAAQCRGCSRHPGSAGASTHTACPCTHPSASGPPAPTAGLCKSQDLGWHCLHSSLPLLGTTGAKIACGRQAGCSHRGQCRSIMIGLSCACLLPPCVPCAPCTPCRQPQGAHRAGEHRPRAPSPQLWFIQMPLEWLFGFPSASLRVRAGGGCRGGWQGPNETHLQRARTE